MICIHMLNQLWMCKVLVVSSDCLEVTSEGNNLGIPKPQLFQMVFNRRLFFCATFFQNVKNKNKIK
jgi:hypothetical protein